MVSSFSICDKRKLGYMFRTFYKQCSTEVLLNLYKHLIRPTLEYCCSVWDPSSKSLIVELEKAQKRAAKICLKDRTSPYAILLKRLDLPTLQSWQTYIKLFMVYRILNEDMYFPPGIFVYRNSSVHTRNYNPLQLLPYSSNTMYFMCFFAPQAVTLWNSLPPSVTGSPPLSMLCHMYSCKCNCCSNLFVLYMLECTTSFHATCIYTPINQRVGRLSM